LNQH